MAVSSSKTRVLKPLDISSIYRRISSIIIIGKFVRFPAKMASSEKIDDYGRAYAEHQMESAARAARLFMANLSVPQPVVVVHAPAPAAAPAAAAPVAVAGQKELADMEVRLTGKIDTVSQKADNVGAVLGPKMDAVMQRLIDIDTRMGDAVRVQNAIDKTELFLQQQQTLHDTFLAAIRKMMGDTLTAVGNGVHAEFVTFTGHVNKTIQDSTRLPGGTPAGRTRVEPTDKTAVEPVDGKPVVVVKPPGTGSDGLPPPLGKASNGPPPPLELDPSTAPMALDAQLAAAAAKAAADTAAAAAAAAAAWYASRAQAPPLPQPSPQPPITPGATPPPVIGMSPFSVPSVSSSTPQLPAKTRFYRTPGGGGRASTSSLLSRTTATTTAPMSSAAAVAAAKAASEKSTATTRAPPPPPPSSRVTIDLTGDTGKAATPSGAPVTATSLTMQQRLAAVVANPYAPPPSVLKIHRDLNKESIDRMDAFAKRVQDGMGMPRTTRGRARDATPTTTSTPVVDATTYTTNRSRSLSPVRNKERIRPPVTPRTAVAAANIAAAALSDSSRQPPRPNPFANVRGTSGGDSGDDDDDDSSTAAPATPSVFDPMAESNNKHARTGESSSPRGQKRAKSADSVVTTDVLFSSQTGEFDEKYGQSSSVPATGAPTRTAPPAPAPPPSSAFGASSYGAEFGVTQSTLIDPAQAAYAAALRAPVSTTTGLFGGQQQHLSFAGLAAGSDGNYHV